MSGTKRERESDDAAGYILTFVGIAVPVGTSAYLALRASSGLPHLAVVILALTAAALTGLVLVRIRIVRRIVINLFDLLTIQWP